MIKSPGWPPAQPAMSWGEIQTQTQQGMQMVDAIYGSASAGMNYLSPRAGSTSFSANSLTSGTGNVQFKQG